MEQIVEKWEDGWRVRLPLPFELKWIYSYILQESDGYTIVDSGLHYDAAWDTWRDVFETLNIQPHTVNRVVLTHYHPDHYGLAGKLQQETGADVWMSKKTYEQAQQFWGERRTQAEDLVAFFRQQGLPRAQADKLATHLQQFVAWVTPHPVPRFVEPGETMALGGRDYEVWSTPGHAEGHVSFYDPERQWLIGGDVLLRKMTPNISWFPHGDPNPLQTYLNTLNQLKERPIQRVLPAHGPVFDDVQTRIDEILHHHAARLAQIEQLAVGENTPYDICRQLFGDKLSIHNLRFALAETVAHLVYLQREGRLSL